MTKLAFPLYIYIYYYTYFFFLNPIEKNVIIGIVLIISKKTWLKSVIIFRLSSYFRFFRFKCEDCLGSMLSVEIRLRKKNDFFLPGGINFLLAHSDFFGFFPQPFRSRLPFAAITTPTRTRTLHTHAHTRTHTHAPARTHTHTHIQCTLNITRLMLHVTRCTCTLYHVQNYIAADVGILTFSRVHFLVLSRAKPYSICSRFAFFHVHFFCPIYARFLPNHTKF